MLLLLVYVDSLRTMHINACTALGLPDNTVRELQELLGELEKLLEGIKFIGELTPRTKDSLVSFGERMSVRIVAANLNRLGVPSQAFDAWTLGILSTFLFVNFIHHHHHCYCYHCYYYYYYYYCKV